MSGKDQPLVCRVEGDELVIRIGIDTLACLANAINSLGCYKNPEIIDSVELARDVVSELDREHDDGYTFVGGIIADAISMVRDRQR